MDWIENGEIFRAIFFFQKRYLFFPEKVPFFCQYRTLPKISRLGPDTFFYRTPPGHAEI